MLNTSKQTKYGIIYYCVSECNTGLIFTLEIATDHAPCHHNRYQHRIHQSQRRKERLRKNKMLVQNVPSFSLLYILRY